MRPRFKARLFFRSLLLQALWNFESFQNAGFAYAMEPWLKDCWTDAEPLKRARERHLGFFNTQPYMASLVLGVVCHMEQAMTEMSRDLQAVAVEKMMRFKSAIAPALAALGDAFFWGALRPFLAALAVAAYLLLERAGVASAWLWAAGLYLAAHNAAALTLRWWGLGEGYDQGARLAAGLQRLRLKSATKIVRGAGLALGSLLLLAALFDPRGLRPAWTGLLCLIFAGLLRFGAGVRSVYTGVLAAAAGAALLGFSIG